MLDVRDVLDSLYFLNKGFAMKIGRGLFRAWILISILWTLGAGCIAYSILAPDTLHGRFQPVVVIKKETTAQQVEKIDFGKPFYNFGVSPSQLNL
jgi:hypothetical protein